MFVDFVSFVLVLLLLAIISGWLIHVRLKQKSTYAAACQLPGATMYPIIGNLFEVLFLNPEQTFRYMRSNASTYKQSSRFWIFGVLHYNAIRAADIEVYTYGDFELLNF